MSLIKEWKSSDVSGLAVGEEANTSTSTFMTPSRYGGSHPGMHGSWIRASTAFSIRTHT